MTLSSQYLRWVHTRASSSSILFGRDLTFPVMIARTPGSKHFFLIRRLTPALHLRHLLPSSSRSEGFYPTMRLVVFLEPTADRVCKQGWGQEAGSCYYRLPPRAAPENENQGQRQEMTDSNTTINSQMENRKFD